MQTLQRKFDHKQHVSNFTNFRPLHARNSRTKMAAICNNCNRVGHYSSRCYITQNRQSFQGNLLTRQRQQFRPSSNFQSSPNHAGQLNYQPRYQNTPQYTRNTRTTFNQSNNARFPALLPHHPPLHHRYEHFMASKMRMQKI